MSRRDQILATAAELFATRGFHGVSVADIGADMRAAEAEARREFDAMHARIEDRHEIDDDGVADDARTDTAQPALPASEEPNDVQR